MYADGGPTLCPQYLRSYHLSGLWPDLAQMSYRHQHDGVLGLNALHFDGHVAWMSEQASRHPDPWFPVGTSIPLTDMNNETIEAVIDQIQEGYYVVQ